MQLPPCTRGILPIVGNTAPSSLHNSNGQVIRTARVQYHQYM